MMLAGRTAWKWVRFAEKSFFRVSPLCKWVRFAEMNF